MRRVSRGACGGSVTCDGPPYSGTLPVGAGAIGTGWAGAGTGGNSSRLRAINKSRIVAISPRFVCAVSRTSALCKPTCRAQHLEELVEWAIGLVLPLLLKFKPDLLQAISLVELSHSLIYPLLV